MQKPFKRTKATRRYMEALALHTGELIVHWQDNKSCIYVVGDKRVTPIVKDIDITICFLKEQFDNGVFVTKYEKSSFIPEYMCNKPCTVTIISRITKCMTGLRFYPDSDIEHYQLMRLHEFVVN